jgi:hypothetical protein
VTVASPLPTRAETSRAPKSIPPLWAPLAWMIAALPVLLWAAPNTSLYKRSLLPEMVDGTAYRPYVQRVLVPGIARAGEAIAGPSVRAAAARVTSRTPFLRDRLRWVPDRAVAFAVVLCVHFLALVAFAWGFYALASATWTVGPALSAVAATAAVLLVPLHFGYQNYVYDFSALALFTWGLVLVRRRSWGAFAVLWPIGLLNKETFVLVSPVFVRRFRAVNGRIPWAWLALTWSVAVVIVLGLWLAFRHTPGEHVEFHLLRNLAYHPSLKQLRRDVAYVAFWVFACWGWRAKRPLIGDALYVGAVLFVSTFFLGFIGEWRDFYEVFPIGLLLALHTALRIAGRPPALRS